MTAPTATESVRVIDTSLYGADHETGTVARRADGQVLVRFTCRCRVNSALADERARAPHELWFPAEEVEPA